MDLSPRTIERPKTVILCNARKFQRDRAKALKLPIRHTCSALRVAWLGGLVLSLCLTSVATAWAQSPIELAAVAKHKKQSARKKGAGHTRGAKKSSHGHAAPVAAPKAKPTSKPAVQAYPPQVPVLPVAPNPSVSNEVVAPVLDLSAPTAADAQATEQARQEILGNGPSAFKQAGKDTIDFGGGIELIMDGQDANQISFDFGGEDALGMDLGQIDTESKQRESLEGAMALMADEEYGKAAMQLRGFLEDPLFKNFVPEIQYQLGRSLYKLGFFSAAHSQFRQILQTGPTHRRFRKAVEWLFFMSHKLADQQPILSELARFRGLTFPPAYRDEYNFLLAKYLFVQAKALEMRRLKNALIQEGKQSASNTINFGEVASAIEGAEKQGGTTTLDFGALQKNLGLNTGSGARNKPLLDFSPQPSSTLDFGAPTPQKAAKPTDTEEGTTLVELPTTVAEAVRQALGLVAQVSKTSLLYPRAKYLEGLLHFMGNAEQEAVASFQEVVRLLNPKTANEPDPRLRELAFLSLARIHYGHKQFERSVYYYDLIDRDSENWLTSLFESSWAFFQRGEYEKSLGNLLTLQSPFFEKEYFPESRIVRATIYFEACRYPETRQIVDDFIMQYSKLLREMQKVTDSHEAPEIIYANLMGIAQRDASQQDDTAIRVLNLMLHSSELQTAHAVVEQINDSKKYLEKNMSKPFQQSTIGNELFKALNKDLIEASKAAGVAIQSKFEQESYALKNLLAQALRIKIEVTHAEREVLEAQMHHQPDPNPVIPAVARTVVDDEHLYWPYEGEYWRDELGTYELDFSMCKQLRE